MAFLDSSLGALLRWDPLIGMVILTFILTLVTVVIYKYTSNQNELKRLKEESLKLREDMKLYKDDPQKLMDLQKEQLKKGFEPLKHSMVPMIITLVPLLLVFTYLSKFFSNNGNPILLFGSPGSWIGTNGWIIAYLILSIVFNSVLRKLLKVH